MEIPTYCAPARRVSDEKIRDIAVRFGPDSLFAKLLNTVNDLVLVVNDTRQTVYANDNFLNLLGVKDASGILGLRPGEVLNCVHAATDVGGCGTSEHCRQCGAVKALLQGLDGYSTDEECRILSQTGETVVAYDLKVRVTPLKDGPHRLVVFSVVDLSDMKRRRVLEKLFFHDMLNSMGGLANLTELLPDLDCEQIKADALFLHDAFNRVMEEIQSQKLLMEAESDELMISVNALDVRTVVETVRNAFEDADVVRGKTIRLAPHIKREIFHTDYALLRRILGNMVKNALEASGPGDVIDIACRRIDRFMEFTVKNPSVMPRDVQLSVFKRSFSTKGGGRGLGTWSIKLFTERWLRGQATFVSEEGLGTVFRILLPDLAP